MDRYLNQAMDYQDIATLGIAFGLGLLVGLQREVSGKKLAGVRTFSLISLLGAIAGFLTRDLGNPFILPAFALALTCILYIGNLIKIKTVPEPDMGQTTEVAALLIFAIGGYLVLGHQVLGIIAGTGMAILLFVKERLHGFIARLKKKELDAIMTFAGISLVVLPILPDRSYGPLMVLNPYNIWLMVVLIVGISVVGYFIYKFVGQRVGIISGGVLGGLISSTATTVSYSRKSTESHAVAPMAAFVIMAASSVTLIRVLIEVGIVIPEKFSALLLPFATLFLVMTGLSLGMFYLLNRKGPEEEMPEPSNPAQFKSALVFGLLYGIILLAVAFAKKEFGSGALYGVAVISGLTDMDAITLSLSQLMKKGTIETNVGWRLILTAALSNLVFKTLLVLMMGSRALLKWLAVSFGISIAAGLLLIWLWPANWHF